MALYAVNREWLLLLRNLTMLGRASSPRALGTRELIAYTSVIDMEFPVLTVAGRRLGYRFLCAEAAWILSGDNRVATIAPYSKEISQFSDDGVTFAGAYGPPLADQLSWVAAQLKEDPFTRRAVATVWRPRPGPTRDYPCTVALQWLLRPRSGTAGAPTWELSCVATMRSSDAWLGWPYDVFNFSCVSAYLGALLLKTKAVSALRLGRLHLTAGSQHLYERNEEAAVALVNEAGSPGMEGSAQKAFVVKEPLLPATWSADPGDLSRFLYARAKYGGAHSPVLGGTWLTELPLVGEPKETVT